MKLFQSLNTNLLGAGFLVLSSTKATTANVICSRHLSFLKSYSNTLHNYFTISNVQLVMQGKFIFVHVSLPLWELIQQALFFPS